MENPWSSIPAVSRDLDERQKHTLGSTCVINKWVGLIVQGTHSFGHALIIPRWLCTMKRQSKVPKMAPYNWTNTDKTILTQQRAEIKWSWFIPIKSRNSINIHRVQFCLRTIAKWLLFAPSGWEFCDSSFLEYLGSESAENYICAA